MNNYTETLSFLYNSFPMFQKSGPGAYKPGLGNSLALAELFGNPQHRINNLIHIAGTNGKGSTAHTLAAVLQSQGYRTALYTSPHLVDFRERIRINGQKIPQQRVIDFVNRFIESGSTLQPSFFELTTIMAFEWFAEEKVDFAVIETGLGGRLDTTNIIMPILSIITNISPDHTALLGNTPQQIAREKAGIIKTGKPVVIGHADAAIRNVFMERAAESASPITFAEQSNEIISSCSLNSGRLYNTRHYGEIFGELGGDCQKENTATILASISVLTQSGIQISTEAVKNGFAHVTELTGLMGRWQTLAKSPLVIADTGHNIGGWKWLAPQIANSVPGIKHLILGFVNDKDINSVLSLIKTIPNIKITFTQASVNRALPASELAARAAMLGIEGSIIDSVAEAYKKVLAETDKDDMVFVGGSTFVVADLLESLYINGQL